jgi:hypothetical protein
MAGDLILATTSDGRVFVQFSKDPFPILNAQKTSRRWELRIPARNQRWSGYGSPPRRIPWLWLPEVLAGHPAPPWRLQASGPDRQRLENPKTGEFIELVFTP